MRLIKPTLLFILLVLAPLLVSSDDANSEIEHLLITVGKSNCTFFRNEKMHTSADAEEHLRLKYRKGKKWIDTAEQFITRIATQSSLSGKPYYIRCIESEQLTGEWLTKELAAYRQQE